MALSERIEYAAIGAAVASCFGRLALHSTGQEPDLYRYFVPLILGALAGLLLGQVKKRWLAEAKQALKRESQGTIRTARSLCHELTQPLQTITGHSELLLMDTPKNEPAYESLWTIREQVDRMTVLMERLREVIRNGDKEQDKKAALGGLAQDPSAPSVFPKQTQREGRGQAPF